MRILRIVAVLLALFPASTASARSVAEGRILCSRATLLRAPVSCPTSTAATPTPTPTASNSTPRPTSTAPRPPSTPCFAPKLIARCSTYTADGAPVRSGDFDITSHYSAATIANLVASVIANVAADETIPTATPTATPTPTRTPTPTLSRTPTPTLTATLAMSTP